MSAVFSASALSLAVLGSGGHENGERNGTNAKALNTASHTVLALDNLTYDLGSATLRT